MDVYIVLKFLHVIAAMAWFGAGAVLLFLSIIAMRRRDNAELMFIAGKMGFLGAVWFLPASGLTVLLGVGMATVGGLWGEAWVVLGLIGALGSFVTGHFFLRPLGMTAGALMAEGRVDDASVQARRLMQIAQFDYCVIAAIVALMVLKPGWGDILTLSTLAVLLTAAGILLLAPRGQVEATA